jgi:hypothetical protein
MSDIPPINLIRICLINIFSSRKKIILIHTQEIIYLKFIDSSDVRVVVCGRRVLAGGGGGGGGGCD